MPITSHQCAPVEDVDRREPDQSDAGNCLENGQGNDEALLDAFSDAQAEIDVHRLLAAHSADDRKGQRRPEREDRAADVQQQENTERPVHSHPPEIPPIANGPYPGQQVSTCSRGNLAISAVTILRA